MKKVVFISLMSLMFLFASANNLFACSCLFSDKPLKQQVKDSYINSAAIFSGEVTNIIQKDEGFVIVKIKVANSWKGKFSKEIIITTSKESSMCGYSFEVGQKYIVYADGEKNNLRVNNCSRTTSLSNKTDVKFLNKLKQTKGKSS